MSKKELEQMEVEYRMACYLEDYAIREHDFDLLYWALDICVPHAEVLGRYGVLDA